MVLSSVSTVPICADPYCYGVLFKSVEYTAGTRFILRIAMCECSVHASLSFPLSALVHELVGHISEFTSVEDIAAQGVRLLLRNDAHNSVRSVGLFEIMSNCTGYPMNAFLAYSRSLKAYRLHEGCAGWSVYNAATGDLASAPPSHVHSQKRARWVLYRS